LFFGSFCGNCLYGHKNTTHYKASLLGGRGGNTRSSGTLSSLDSLVFDLSNGISEVSRGHFYALVVGEVVGVVKSGRVREELSDSPEDVELSQTTDFPIALPDGVLSNRPPVGEDSGGQNLSGQVDFFSVLEKDGWRSSSRGDESSEVGGQNLLIELSYGRFVVSAVGIARINGLVEKFFEPPELLRALVLGN